MLTFPAGDAAALARCLARLADDPDGADAMAGVLNFIMKDRFEGFEVDATGSMTQEGDNEELTISTVIGTNFDDDKGNVMMAMAYNKRYEALNISTQ